MAMTLPADSPDTDAMDLTPPPSVAAIVRFLEELEVRAPVAGPFASGGPSSESAPGARALSAAQFGGELAARGPVAGSPPEATGFAPLWSRMAQDGGQGARFGSAQFGTGALLGAGGGDFYHPSSEMAFATSGRGAGGFAAGAETGASIGGFTPAPTAPATTTAFGPAPSPAASFAFPAVQEITEFLDWLSRLDLVPNGAFASAQPDPFYASPSENAAYVPVNPRAEELSGGYAPQAPAAYSNTHEQELSEDTPAARRRVARARRQQTPEPEPEELISEEPVVRKRTGLVALEKAALTVATLGVTASLGISHGRDIGFAQGLASAQPGITQPAAPPSGSPLDFILRWGGGQPSPSPYAPADAPMPLSRPPIPTVSYTGRATPAPESRADTYAETESAATPTPEPEQPRFARPIRVPRPMFMAPMGSGQEKSDDQTEPESEPPPTDPGRDPRMGIMARHAPLQTRLQSMPGFAPLPLLSVPTLLTNLSAPEELSSAGVGGKGAVGRAEGTGTPGRTAGLVALGFSAAVATLLLLPSAGQAQSEPTSGTPFDRPSPMSRAALPPTGGQFAAETGDGFITRSGQTTEDTEQPIAPPVARFPTTTAAAPLTLPTLEAAVQLLAGLPASGAAAPGVAPGFAPSGELAAARRVALDLSALGVPALRASLNALIAGTPAAGLPGVTGQNFRARSPLPAPRPELGQVTLVAPPLAISTPDAERGGVALRLDWQTLAGGAGVLDAGSLARLQAVLPENAQVLYPALPSGSLGKNAVNLAVDASLLTGLLERGYGPEATVLAEPSALLGRAGAGRTSAMPLPASIIPTVNRPMGTQSSLLGETPGQPQTLQSAGGDSSRGGPLDLMGMPVRVAPSLAGQPELSAAISARTANPGMPSALRPTEFAPLRDRLFGAFQSVEPEPDAGEWRKASPAFGLRDSNPTALLAPDARAPRITDTTPLPQLGDATAAATNPLASLSPVLASVLPGNGGSGAVLRPGMPMVHLTNALPGLPSPARPSSLSEPANPAPPVGGLSPLLDRLPGGMADIPATSFAPALSPVMPSAPPGGMPSVPSLISNGAPPAASFAAPLLRMAPRATTAPTVIRPMTSPSLPPAAPVSSPTAESESGYPVPSLADAFGAQSPASVNLPVVGGLGSERLSPIRMDPPTAWSERRPSRSRMLLSSGPRPNRQGSPALLQRSPTARGGESETKEAATPSDNGSAQLASSEGGANAAEVDLLATEVYALLKRRLKNEMERRGRW